MIFFYLKFFFNIKSNNTDWKIISSNFQNNYINICKFLCKYIFFILHIFHDEISLLFHINNINEYVVYTYLFFIVFTNYFY